MNVLYFRNHVPGAWATAYDEFVLTAGGRHFMQARTFAGVTPTPGTVRRFLLALEGDRVVGAASVLRGGVGPLRSPYAVIERGPVVDEPRMLQTVLPAMLAALRWHGVDRVRVQPNFVGPQAGQASAICHDLGFCDGGAFDGPYQATLRVPLANVPVDQIFAGKALAETRRCAKKAEQAGATTRLGGPADLLRFAALYRAMMEAQGACDRASWYFRAFGPMIVSGAAALIVGEFAGQTDCMLLLCRHADGVTLHMGATSPIKRSYKKMLLPIFAAARWAQSNGASYLDLGGVPAAADTDEKRRRIAQFKYDFATDLVPMVPAMQSAAGWTRRLQSGVRGLRAFLGDR